MTTLGKSLMDFYNPATQFPNGEERPLTRIVMGKAESAWDSTKTEFDVPMRMRELNEKRIGVTYYWDERGHEVRQYKPGQDPWEAGVDHWVMSPRLSATYMSRYRRSQSYPAFSNDDYDDAPGRQPDPGTGEPAEGLDWDDRDDWAGDPWAFWNGDDWGVWGGGYLDWDLETITDTAGSWGITLFMVSESTFANDISSADSVSTDVTVRRAQSFKPPSGRDLAWRLVRVSDQALLQSGEVIVDAEGLVTVCGLTLSKVPARLEIALKNNAPVLDPVGDRSVDEGETLGFTLSAADPDLPAQTLTFSAEGLPAGATLNSESGAFSWTPTEAQGPGDYTVTFRVSDGFASDAETVEISVAEINLPPVLAAINDREVNEGSLLSFTLGASDPDAPAQTLTFSSANLPAGATLDPVSGGFSWVPTEEQGPGTYGVTCTVSDGIASDSKSFEIVVAEVNLPPEISSASPESPFAMNAGESQVFEIWPHDEDGDVLTCTWKLDGTQVGDVGTGYAYSPSGDEVGEHVLAVTVSDGRGGTDSHSWNLTVRGDGSGAPTISALADQSTESGVAVGPIAFTVGDAQTSPAALTLSAFSSDETLLPEENIVFAGSGAERTVTLTPAAGRTGTTTVTITVSDGLLDTSESFVLTVSTSDEGRGGEAGDDGDDGDGGSGGGSGGGGGGGGGCAMVAGKNGDPLSFFLPYLVAGLVVLGLRLICRNRGNSAHLDAADCGEHRHEG